MLNGKRKPAQTSLFQKRNTAKGNYIESAGTKEQNSGLIKDAKYYCIIIVCTPDISQKVQTSVIVCCIHIEKVDNGHKIMMKLKKCFWK